MRVVFAALLALVVAPAALQAQQPPPPAPPATTAPPPPDGDVVANVHDASGSDSQCGASRARGRLREGRRVLARRARVIEQPYRARAGAGMARVQGGRDRARTEQCCMCFCSTRRCPAPNTVWVAILAEAYPEQAKLQEIWKLYTDSLASGGSLLSLTPVKIGGAEAAPLPEK